MHSSPNSGPGFQLLRYLIRVGEAAAKVKPELAMRFELPTFSTALIKEGFRPEEAFAAKRVFRPPHPPRSRSTVAPPTNSGYIIAIMRYAIVLAPSAVRELRALPARHRARVRDELERHLRHEPAKVSKSRIKRLRGLSRPQFRLRIDDIRVFYDVTDTAVEVLAIISKAQASEWLSEHGEEPPGGAPGKGEG